MIASVASYSLMRLRRSRPCFTSSLRRSKPTVAADTGAKACLAPRSTGADTFASARACAKVTGPAAPAFRVDFAERPDRVLAGALRRERFLAIEWSLPGSTECEHYRRAFSDSIARGNRR